MNIYNKDNIKVCPYIWEPTYMDDHNNIITYIYNQCVSIQSSNNFFVLQFFICFLYQHFAGEDSGIYW